MKNSEAQDIEYETRDYETTAIKLNNVLHFKMIIFKTTIFSIKFTKRTTEPNL